MASKDKKFNSSSSRRIYTTREIMEITERRRKKEEAARIEEEARLKSRPETVLKPTIEPVPQSIEPIVEKIPETLPASISQPDPEIKSEAMPVEEITSEPIVEPVIKPMPESNHIPVFTKTFEETENVEVLPSKSTVFTVIRPLILIFSLLVFLIISSSRLSGSWVEVVSARLNDLILYGSLFVLKIIQGTCAIDGPFLSTHYYILSLKGDWVAFYSFEMLIAFAALFAYFQKTSLFKRGMVFCSLIPLAIIANILRVVMAFGLALNDGAAVADKYFYGILVGFVFIFMVVGLLVLEFLSSPE